MKTLKNMRFVEDNPVSKQIISKSDKIFFNKNNILITNPERNKTLLYKADKLKLKKKYIFIFKDNKRLIVDGLIKDSIIKFDKKIQINDGSRNIKLNQSDIMNIKISSIVSGIDNEQHYKIYGDEDTLDDLIDFYKLDKSKSKNDIELLMDLGKVFLSQRCKYDNAYFTLQYILISLPFVINFI